MKRRTRIVKGSQEAQHWTDRAEGASSGCAAVEGVAKCRGTPDRDNGVGGSQNPERPDPIVETQRAAAARREGLRGCGAWWRRRSRCDGGRDQRDGRLAGAIARSGPADQRFHRRRDGEREAVIRAPVDRRPAVVPRPHAERAPRLARRPRSDCASRRVTRSGRSPATRRAASPVRARSSGRRRPTPPARSSRCRLRRARTRTLGRSQRPTPLARAAVTAACPIPHPSRPP